MTMKNLWTWLAAFTFLFVLFYSVPAEAGYKEVQNWVTGALGAAIWLFFLIALLTDARAKSHPTLYCTLTMVFGVLALNPVYANFPSSVAVMTLFAFLCALRSVLLLQKEVRGATQAESTLFVVPFGLLLGFAFVGDGAPVWFLWLLVGLDLALKYSIASSYHERTLKWPARLPDW